MWLYSLAKRRLTGGGLFVDERARPPLPFLPGELWDDIYAHTPRTFQDASVARLVEKRAAALLRKRVAHLQRYLLWTECLLHPCHEGALTSLRAILLPPSFSSSKKLALIVSLCHSQLKLKITRLVLDWAALFPSDFAIREEDLTRFAHCFFEAISRPPSGLYVLFEGKREYLLAKDGEEPFLFFQFSSVWREHVRTVLRTVWVDR